MDVRAALRSQYHASLRMLRQAVDDCPEELWVDETRPPYWQIVFHTLFFTHLYLMPHVDDFEPWAKHPGHLEDLEVAPDAPVPTKAELTEYLDYVVGLVDQQVPTLDLDAALSGFHRYDPMPKLDHQLNNIRHIQHHVAVLSDRLRAARGDGVNWVGRPR